VTRYSSNRSHVHNKRKQLAMGLQPKTNVSQLPTSEMNAPRGEWLIHGVAAIDI
jgi:hypothetical protein